MKSTLLALETLFIALLSALVLTGCVSHRPLQVAEHLGKDTLYLSNVQYDSIYIFQERTSDYHMNPLNPLKPSETDTVFIKDVSVEYRYRLLRDTIYKVQHDSIPYEVRIETVREVPRRRNILDYISYACLGLVIGSVLTRLYHYFR